MHESNSHDLNLSQHSPCQAPSLLLPGHAVAAKAIPTTWIRTI